MTIVERSTAFPLTPHRPATRRRIAGCSAQWHRPWLERLRTFNAFVSSMSLLAGGSAASHVSVAPTRVPFSASLTVSPTIGQINAPRLLTVTAHFPLGRGPTNATVSIVTLNGVQILEVRFDTPSPDFAFSDLVLVPYTVEMTYSPSEAGDLPVRMMTSDGIPVGASVVMTRHAKGGVAQFEVTGKWNDPATRETGLAFEADSTHNNVVVGTWNIHDHQGVRRRYAIQSVHWKERDVEAEGAIFDTVPGSQLGIVRITFQGLSSARVFALGFGGNVLFTSNLVRTTH